MTTLQLKRLSDIPTTPNYGSAGAAGIDFFWPQSVAQTLQPGQDYKIPLGFAVAVPDGFCLMLAPRSGLGAKYGMRLKNTVGVIDSDYRGELLAVFTVEEACTIQPGQALLQGIVIPVGATLKFVDGDLPATARGDGGFGSTDKTADGPVPNSTGTAPAPGTKPEHDPAFARGIAALRGTRTVVQMGLSQTAYDEIATNIRNAGYEHLFMNDEGAIDMTGIAVVANPEIAGNN
jgi:dUTP pyrophosphatase